MTFEKYLCLPPLETVKLCKFCAVLGGHLVPSNQFFGLKVICRKRLDQLIIRYLVCRVSATR